MPGALCAGHDPGMGILRGTVWGVPVRQVQLEVVRHAAGRRRAAGGVFEDADRLDAGGDRQWTDGGAESFGGDDAQRGSKAVDAAVENVL